MSAQAFSADQRVNRDRPCPVCGKEDWCAFSSDGRFIFCKRQDEWRGKAAVRESDAGWHFLLAEPVATVAPLPLQLPAKRASAGKSKSVEPKPEPLARALLDHVYRVTAELCGLDEFGRDEIVTRRQFPGALDTGVPYFSLPRSGGHVEQVSRQLVAQFGTDVLARVPGFRVHCKGCDGAGTAVGRSCSTCNGDGRQAPQLWSVRGKRHDFAIMACDEDGLAFWGTARRLPFDSRSSGSKYMLLSSSRSADASISGLPKYHVAGRDFPSDRVFVTEGILKAEIIAFTLRCRVIGIYSTSVDAPTLAEVSRLARLWRSSEFVIAFDADKHELNESGKAIRPGVLKGEQKLIEALLRITDVYSAEWDLNEGKGLDDLLTNGGNFRLVDRYEHPTPRPRVPRPCPEPGRVDEGDAIEDVRRETGQRISDRFEAGYSGTVVILAPPPGTAKTGGGLRALESGNGNVAWAVSRHEQASELVVRASTEACQCGTKRGDCDDHRIVLHHDRGRRPDNCGNYDVVQAAQEAGYGSRIGQAICGSDRKPICPMFWQCRYQDQFNEPGSHVAPVEMVTQRITFTDRMETVVFDDLDSARLISSRKVTERTLEKVISNAKGTPLRPLARVLQRALQSATNEGSYHRAAYDNLDTAARSLGTTLGVVLAKTPRAPRLTPAPTVEGYQAAVPGQMVDLVELLHEEFPLYQAGKPFTSGLRITAGGIETTQLLKPMARTNGSTALSGRAAIVLSSTPDPVLRQWVAGLGLQVDDEYRPLVPLPPNVKVIQDTSGFYGKSSTQKNGIEPLLVRARGYVAELAPERLAAVTYKHLQEQVARELGIPVERVLYFGNMRGSNALRDADVLFVIGTPGMNPADAYWMACAAYRGEGKPPSQHRAMQFRQYGGWRDAKGRGREIEVHTFVDPRVGEIYESARRDELIQAIFRCRPYDLGDAASGRTSLTVVLFTAQPIDGLRVDELRFGGNTACSEDARARREDAA